MPLFSKQKQRRAAASSSKVRLQESEKLGWVFVVLQRFFFNEVLLLDVVLYATVNRRNQFTFTVWNTALSYSRFPVTFNMNSFLYALECTSLLCPEYC